MSDEIYSILTYRSHIRPFYRSIRPLLPFVIVRVPDPHTKDPEKIGHPREQVSEREAEEAS